MSGKRRRLRAELVLIPCLVLCGFALRADETPKPSDTPAAETPAAAAETPAAETPADPLAAWKPLAERKLAIAKELQALSKEFQTATVERKREIQAAFNTLLIEFRTEITPQMVELAPKVFEADPKNVDAGEFVLQTAWLENRYDDAVKVGEALLADGHETRMILNLAGSANYAVHNFDRCIELLTKAKEQGVISPEAEYKFLEGAAEVKELWVKEQAIREKEAALEGDERLPRVLLKTSRGDVTLELFENEAPNTVANFVSLVESKFYDGIKFHRVIANFMAQAGDANTKTETPSSKGELGPGYTIECECFAENARNHFAGSLSMAKLSAPNTGGSQFFITHLPTPNLNGNKELQYGHTVFGRVVEGLDVARSLEQGDVIESATVLFKRNHEYVPVTTPEPAAAAEKKPDAGKDQKEPEKKDDAPAEKAVEKTDE